MANKRNKKPINDSEIGTLLRNKNWTNTSLGAIEEWPQTLHTIVNVILAASKPMLVLWGPDHLCIYNDAYLSSLSPENHPDALGKPGSKAVKDIWETFSPQIKKVMAGEDASANEDVLIPTSQNGEPVSQYWTFNYSPIISDDKESIEGVLIICTETTEKVKASSQLQKSEEQMRHLFNSIKEYAIITLDAERNITSWNDGATRIMGYKEEKILGEKADIFFLPEDRKKNTPEKEIFLAKTKGRAENRRWHLRKDGTRFWGSGLMLPLEETEKEGYVKIFRDRTQERLAEKELEASEQKYRSLFNSIDEGFCIIEKLDTPAGEPSDFRYIETNPAFDQQAGVANVKGKTIRKTLPEIDESWIDLYDKVVKEKTAKSVEKYIKEVDRTLELHAFPLQKAEKERIAVLFIDVTKQKKTEHFLKQNEERAIFFTSLTDEFRLTSDPVLIQEKAVQKLSNQLGASRVEYGEIESDGTITVQRKPAENTSKYNLNDVGTNWLKSLRKGKTLVVENVESNLELNNEQKSIYEKNKVLSFVVVPLLIQNELIAILSVQQSEKRQWSSTEISIIEETADRTWTAVEHARTEKLLRQSENKYRSLFNSIDEGFCILEKVKSDFKILEINPAFKVQSGINNPVGKTIRKISTKLDGKLIANLDQVLETGTPFRFEFNFGSPKRIISLYVFKSDVYSDRVAVIFNDITTERKIERDLRKSGERLRAALNGTEVGVWDLNLDKNSTWRSQKHDQIFGYSAERSEWNYDIFLEHVIPEDREQVDQKFQTALATAGKWDFECRIQRIDGQQRWIDVRGRVLKGDSGNPKKRLVGTIQDITGRKENQEKLESVNETLEKRVKERTAALLSYQDQLRSLAAQLSKAEELERHRLAADLHDNLGQLLAMSKIELGLLKDHVSDGSFLDSISDLLNQAITYTRELMSDLKPPPSLDAEDIAASVEWTAQKLKKHGLNVSITDDEKSKPVSKEVRAALVQAVREALFNIVKHANVEKATIDISLINGQALISVSDKGKGFDIRENKTSLSIDGGFGLFSIRERLDLLGGKVQVQSQPGKGTTVDIFAPLLINDENVPISTKKESAKEVTLPKEETGIIRVLLVDDHQMMLKGLRKIIEQEGNLKVIAEATNGKEAIKLARKHSPDVIVMDVDMPIMNGIDATREIIATMDNMRVIGLSLHEKGSVAEAMRNAGATAYLTKTEAFEALSATIRSEAVLAKK